MSELNSTSDDQYFFIVSKYSGLVLGISTGKKGGDLILSKVRGKSSQLWRLDEDRRLVSKLGLVADIKGKNKKPGTVCHAWKAHDGLNQKWRFEDDEIKSDLNNLVIDARNQSVSMYEVDGSLPQKWYFVPKNAWPDGRLVVPSLKYFFIVNQTNGLVLEISTGKKGGDLVLSEACGKLSQLWRLDEDRRLVSKLGLVADIKGKNKNAGTVCHAWNAHDGFNQKWHFEDDAIKSDLNNLVIDARNQSVSMYEVDGSLPQKWYFVPENDWPDGRLVVLSFKYFFIVNQEKGSVLEISTGRKGGDLILSEANGKPSQLWRWDDDCRLVSKLGLVADIKGKNKKPGTVCHAWKAHDGFNQKWHFEDDAIKSDLNNLAIDARNQSVSMYEVDGSLRQKWYFVPENDWPDGRLVVPSFKYFFIVNQEKGSVLEISTGRKGGDLILSEANGKPSQLWRWDEDCRLVSKLGLVADIKGKNKKPGTVCHAWKAHDGFNQKWHFEDDAIKSDLNNLAIGAQDHSVSMSEVDGSLPQKWYFVPENDWPDGRLVVPSFKYFFIVNQEKGSVLEISTGRKGGDLILSEANGKPSQLWRWDDDCRLVSKLGLVADIKGKNKKPGTVCHAWKAHDGFNQKWHFEDDAIKSDLNNLAIGARDHSVSMCEVDGSLRQKWYFVPENAWPEGRLVVPSVRYFFMVNQTNELVLDISTGMKNGDLVLSEADGKPSQLWRWDKDCRLVSKLGLVADIKGKNKKPGAVCHAWNAHDGLNQKWCVEEGAIKSRLNDLVIDATEQSITMKNAKEGTSSQKWYLIPEKAWDDFKLVQANPNPLKKAQFWKLLADRYLDVIIGYSIGDYEDKLQKALKISDKCSRKLNAVTKDTGIAGTVGGSASIVGGGMVVVGLALAPITAGASIGLTFAGTATGFAGGLTSTASSLVSLHWNKSKAKEVEKATAPLIHATFSLHGFLEEYINILKDANEFLGKPEGEAVAKDAYRALKKIKVTGEVAWRAYNIFDVVCMGVTHAKQARQIKVLANFLQADYYAVKDARIVLATQTAARGFKIPGKTVVAAGTTTAKALSGVMAGMGIILGIWDVVDGAKKIKNFSQLAHEFRKSSESLKEESAKLIALYEELQ